MTSTPSIERVLGVWSAVVGGSLSILHADALVGSWLIPADMLVGDLGWRLRVVGVCYVVAGTVMLLAGVSLVFALAEHVRLRYAASASVASSGAVAVLTSLLDVSGVWKGATESLAGLAIAGKFVGWALSNSVSPAILACIAVTALRALRRGAEPQVAVGFAAGVSALLSLPVTYTSLVTTGPSLGSVRLAPGLEFLLALAVLVTSGAVLAWRRLAAVPLIAALACAALGVHGIWSSVRAFAAVPATLEAIGWNAVELGAMLVLGVANAALPAHVWLLAWRRVRVNSRE